MRSRNSKVWGWVAAWWCRYTRTSTIRGAIWQDARRQAMWAHPSSGKVWS